MNNNHKVVAGIVGALLLGGLIGNSMNTDTTEAAPQTTLFDNITPRTTQPTVNTAPPVAVDSWDNPEFSPMLSNLRSGIAATFGMQFAECTVDYIKSNWTPMELVLWLQQTDEDTAAAQMATAVLTDCMDYFYPELY